MKKLLESFMKKKKNAKQIAFIMKKVTEKVAKYVTGKKDYVICLIVGLIKLM